MDIPLNKLNYSFSKKPLLIGGKAMEYYGLRKAGADIDFIATEEDVIKLIKQYPDKVKDLWGDLGVCPFEFEIWDTICFFSYGDLKKDAIEQKDYLIISLEKLLFMKTLGIKKEKYFKDTQLIVGEINNRQLNRLTKIKSHNEKLLKNVGNITYLERSGPEEKAK
jgi:hypothetical protein